MDTRMKRCLAVAAVAAGVSALRAEVIVKANNTDALSLPSSWIGGVAPGTNDIAQWDYTVTAGASYTLGTNLFWQGLAVAATASNGFSFLAGNTLTLGAAGITTVPDKGFTFSCGLALACDQTWNIAKNTFIPQGGLDLAGRTLTLSGSGKKEFKGPVSGGGRIVKPASGTLYFTGTTAAAPTTDFELTGDSLTFSTSSGIPAVPRTKSLALNASALIVGGLSSAHTAETNAEALVVGSGAYSTVTVSPNAAKNAQFYSGSLARPAGRNMILFRGTGLGTNTLASLTPNSANIVFGSAPEMLGAGGVAGSTTNSIIVGAYGDTSAAGTGTGLVTYDAVYGLRLLDFATEYTGAITDGQRQLDNVRYVNTSGAGVIEKTLTQDTAINSLSIVETGLGTNTGVRVIGDVLSRELVLNSGLISARQTLSSAVASDGMVVSNLTLNLNGQEGFFLCLSTGGYNQGNTPGALYLAAAITNDQGKGVTVGNVGSGNAVVYFAGNTTNAYTGPTTLNGGVLSLNKTLNNLGIPGNLVVNNGTLLKRAESIPDTATVTLNGGLFYFDTTTSSGNNSHVETISNLVMNGGAIAYNSGKSHTFTINGDAVVNVGDLRLNTGGDVTVKGTTTLNGGRVLVSLSDSTTAFNAFFTLNHVTITNQAAGAYSNVVLKAHATSKGGKLTLGGTVTFVGNSVNTNAALFISEDASLAQQGVIALDGARTFDIGDGAASIDLLIAPTLTDNGSTTGGLVKAGSGTLSLTGANAYTGATLVSNGTLSVDGFLVSPVAVSSGAALCGTGFVSVAGTALAVSAGGVVTPGAPGEVGTLSVTGDVSFASLAVLRVDVSGPGADCLAVSGAVSGGPVSVQVAGVGTGPWRILSASQITATFTTTEPGLAVYKQAGGTELWLGQRRGTLISVY